MSSWIKIQRDIRDHWVFDNADYFKAWITILIEVNHAKKGVVIKGTPINCERGQCAYSIKTWSEKFGKGWTSQKVRTFFKHLVNDNMILVQEIVKITTKLSVCNYDTYQSNQQTDVKQITNGCKTPNNLLTTIEEPKNLETKNVKKKSSAIINPYKKWNKDDFWGELLKVNTEKNYEQSMIERFFIYWAEMNDKGKMKFQMNKTWSTTGRLANWHSRQNN